VTIYDLKPAFQNLLRPIVKALYLAKVTPNIVTLFTFFLSIAVAFILYFNSQQKWALLLLPIFLFVRMALNAIDGMLAKEHNMRTSLGAILNEGTDVLADGLIYLAFISHPLINLQLVILITWLAAVTEVVGLSALLIGNERRFDGPMGKSDRAFAFSVLALFLALSNFEMQFYTIYLGIVLLLTVLTVMRRGRRALIPRHRK
jgi:CDP-diacylglycerol--glycerol-3-phosphate 3-phosphatidyltransferase